MQKRILILSADAGFGHRAAAEAVAEALRERYGDACNVTVVNPLEDQRTPGVLRRVQNDYDRLLHVTPELYKFGYRASDSALPVGIMEQALIAMLYGTLRDLINSHRPNAIVSTYPLYQAPVAAVFALRRFYVPLLTVVTDLASIHSLWFNDEVDFCLVPNERVREKALQHHLAPHRVVVTGLPVNPAFARTPDRQLLRAQLGLEPGRIIALVAGSKRTKRLAAVSTALNHSGLPLQLILVGGGNESLLAEWRSMEWHLPVQIHGYAENMPELILASDFVISKAGGLIVSEALAAGLPVLMAEAIPGQETGNAEYVVSGGAGELVSDALEALVTVFHWLDRECAELRGKASNARRLGRPDAAQRVAELTWKAAQQGPERREHRLLNQVPVLRELLKDTRSGSVAQRQSRPSPPDPADVS